MLTSALALRRWALGSLIANAALVVTGGLVRVTGSGLGCSTWPQCEPGSYTPHPATGAHGLIEFGNRLLTFVLVGIALGTLITAWRSRAQDGRPNWGVRLLALGAAVGIPIQAVIGGISVLAGLNPWVVGLHMVASIALIVVCVVLVHQTWPVSPAPAARRLRLMIQAVFFLGLAVMLLGVIVTGAGPNSGDGGARRNGLDLLTTARLHAISMWALVTLIVASLVLAAARTRIRGAVLMVLAAAAIQGAIGYVQYFLHLPAALVALHMLGTALFTASIANLWWLTRTATAAPVAHNSSGSSAAAMNTTAR